MIEISLTVGHDDTRPTHWADPRLPGSKQVLASSPSSNSSWMTDVQPNYIVADAWLGLCLRRFNIGSQGKAMPKDWTKYRSDIHRWYLVERKPLGEVRRLVKGKWEFQAS